MTSMLLLIWYIKKYITLGLTVTVAWLLLRFKLLNLIHEFIYVLTGSIPFWVALVSVCNGVKRKHPCCCWQINLAVHFLLVLCYLLWHKWESKGWVRGHAVWPEIQALNSERTQDTHLCWLIFIDPRATVSNTLHWLHSSPFPYPSLFTNKTVWTGCAFLWLRSLYTDIHKGRVLLCWQHSVFPHKTHGCCAGRYTLNFSKKCGNLPKHNYTAFSFPLFSN